MTDLNNLIYDLREINQKLDVDTIDLNLVSNKFRLNQKFQCETYLLKNNQDISQRIFFKILDTDVLFLYDEIKQRYVLKFTETNQFIDLESKINVLIEKKFGFEHKINLIKNNHVVMLTDDMKPALYQEPEWLSGLSTECGSGSFIFSIKIQKTDRGLFVNLQANPGGHIFLKSKVKANKCQFVNKTIDEDDEDLKS